MSKCRLRKMNDVWDFYGHGTVYVSTPDGCWSFEKSDFDMRPCKANGVVDYDVQVGVVVGISNETTRKQAIRALKDVIACLRRKQEPDSGEMTFEIY